jgi:hypothetical protein
MTKPIGELVREVLLANPEGLTVRDVSKLVGSPMDLVLACLRRTYGCYIADFKPATNGTRNFNAIWCCVAVPANAKKPLSFDGVFAVVDDKQAEQQKRDIARRAAAKKQRAKQALANKKLKEKAAKEKPTQPEYKPQRTTWVSVPSWSSVGASA